MTKIFQSGRKSPLRIISGGCKTKLIEGEAIIAIRELS
jgi:hypothetical protein